MSVGMKTGLRLLLVLALFATSAEVRAQQGETALLQHQLQSWEHDYYELLGSRGLRGGPPMEHIYAVLENNLKEIIPAGTPAALLFYHHSADTLHSWLIRPGLPPMHGFRAVKAASLLQWQEELFSGLRADARNRGARIGGQTGTPSQMLQQPLQALTSVLFPEELRTTLDNLQHLLIIPALNISALPLYLLPAGKDGAPLSSMLSYSILPSFRRLYAVAEVYENKGYSPSDSIYWMPKPGAILSGDPAFPLSANPGFETLPGAAEEVTHISALTGISVLPRENLTPAWLLKKLGSEYGPDFYYLACHGVSDPVFPIDSSFLLLAPDAQHANGRLSAREIQAARGIDPEVYNTDRDAWVFLSACETGLGQTHDAGITGLARAFVLAGARNVWISLWPVDDRATARFMPLVMEELKKPAPFFPAENFRRAVERFRLLDPDPSHWAAFSLMGVPYPVYMQGLFAP